jgi:hypothetical protein
MPRLPSVFLARQSGEGADMDAEVPSFARIATLESLREHLQWPIELEHFTLLRSVSAPERVAITV